MIKVWIKRIGVSVLVVIIGNAATAQDSTAPPGAVTIAPANTLYPLPEVDGVVPWEILVQIEMGYHDEHLMAVFNDTIAELHGTEIKLVGFLMPRDTGRQRMLLSMVSPNCPYCLPGGPGTMVELDTDEPLNWTEGAVVVTGRFEIIAAEWSNIFYRLSAISDVQVVARY